MSDAGASLPEQWAVATIAELIGFKGVFSDGDWVESEDQDPSGDVRLIQLADVGDGRYRDRSSRFLTSIKAAELRCTFLKPGDLLIARMPDPLGRACIFPGDVKASVTVVDVCIVRLESPVCTRWLMHHLNTPQVRRMIAKLQSGTTRKRISRANLATVKVPIPPLEEQVRIAARLDELLSDLDAGVKALEGVRAKLRQYRAAVLKAAVEGILTAEWRKGHSDVEPASELLRRILAERRRRWEEAQLKKYKDAGKEPPKNWKAKYKVPTKPALAKCSLLPERWVWTGFEELSDGVPHALKAGPFGSSLRKEFYSSAGYKIYGQEQVINGDAFFGNYFIDAKRFDLLKSCAVKPGDILISLVGTTGRVLVLPNDASPGIINPRLLKVTLVPDQVRPAFIKLVLESPQALAFFKANAHGGTMDVLNLGILKGFRIPLPPLLEQDALIEAIDDQFSVIDHLESDLEAKLNSAQALRQSILKAAFEGKLVAQDPNDEPASELLKRIATERAERERLAKEAKKAAKPPRVRRPKRGQDMSPVSAG